MPASDCHAGARSHRAEHVVFRRPRRRNTGVTFFRVVGACLVPPRNIRRCCKHPGPKTRFRADVMPCLSQCHLRLSCISCPRAWPPRSWAYAESPSPRCSFAAPVTVVGFILVLLRERYRSPTSTMTPTTRDGFGVPRAESPEDVLKSRFGVCCRTGATARYCDTTRYRTRRFAEPWALLRIYQCQRLFEAVRADRYR